MASEVAAIFCSGAKALSCCVNGSHQKMFHSETRFRRYVPDARRHVWLVGVLRHFCQSYSKRDGTSNLLGTIFFVKFDYHEGPAPPPPWNGSGKAHQDRNPKLRSTKRHQMSWTNLCPPHFLGKRHHFYWWNLSNFNSMSTSYQLSKFAPLFSAFLTMPPLRHRGGALLILWDVAKGVAPDDSRCMAQLTEVSDDIWCVQSVWGYSHT